MTEQEAVEQLDWIRRAQDGDEAAFARLVEAYQGSVYNLCYRMLGNARDAEDAAQETFLRAFRGLRRYDPKRKFSTWILSIASHYCIDQYRRRRVPTVPFEAFPRPDFPGTDPTPEAVFSQGEEQRRVRKLLESLSPTDRAAVVMLYWYDFSYVEIAETLSLSVSAVKSRLHRARKSLAKTWLEENVDQLSGARAHESPAF